MTQKVHVWQIESINGCQQNDYLEVFTGRPDVQEAQEAQFCLSASSIQLLTGSSMPTHLQAILCFDHSAQSWRDVLERRLQAFPDPPQSMAMSLALAVPRSKSDLHVSKPVSKTHQQAQQGLIQTATSLKKPFGYAEVSTLPSACNVTAVWSVSAY